jgi:hypothetical protein
MPATPFDSAIWRGLLADATLGALLTDTAQLRAELLVMGTLALTQAKAGLIPEISAKAIQRAALEVQVDPGALAAETAQNGSSEGALVSQFRAEMKAPEHAQWVHYQSDYADTQATALSLRLRQMLAYYETLLAEADQQTLQSLKPQVLLAYHSIPEIRSELAIGLGLADAKGVSQSQAVAALAQWMGEIAQAIAPSSQMQHALKEIMPAHVSLLTSHASPQVIAFILPQLCLSFGTLLK